MKRVAAKMTSACCGGLGGLGWGMLFGMGCGPASIETPPDDRLTDIVELQVGVTGNTSTHCARDLHGSVFCWVHDNPAQRVEGIDDAVRIGSPHNPLGMHVAVLRSGEVVTWSPTEPKHLVPNIAIISHPPWADLWHSRRPPPPLRVTDHEPIEPPWVARPTGIVVDPPDIFADTGCFFFRGLFSCPDVGAPNYDRLEWWYREGVVDIGACRSPAFIHEPGTANYDDSLVLMPMICLLFDDGRLECTVDQVGQLEEDVSYGDRVYEEKGAWVRRPGRTIAVELPGRPLNLLSRSCPGVWVRYDGGIARINHDGSVDTIADSLLPGEIVGPGEWGFGDAWGLSWLFMRGDDDVLIPAQFPKPPVTRFLGPEDEPQGLSVRRGTPAFWRYQAVPFTYGGGADSMCVLTKDASVACFQCPKGPCMVGQDGAVLRYVRKQVSQ
jgi:hypothetical protein